MNVWKLLLQFANNMCWPCSMNRCQDVIKKDSACSCCRRNHVR